MSSPTEQNPNLQSPLTIIEAAYRVLGVLADGAPLSDSLVNVAFPELCGMLDSWRLEGFLTDSTNGQTTFNLTANKNIYTVGPAGDVPMSIPPGWLDQIFLSDTATQRTYPVALCAGEEFWRAGRNTSITSPYSLYATYLSDFPTASIEFYPIPAISIPCTIIYSEHIAVPTTTTSSMALSPGMRNGIVYSLANILTLFYPTQDNAQRIQQAAADFQERIKDARKHPTPGALLDPAANTFGSGGRMRTSRQGLYDIRSNSYVGVL